MMARKEFTVTFTKSGLVKAAALLVIVAIWFSTGPL